MPVLNTWADNTGVGAYQNDVEVNVGTVGMRTEWAVTIPHNSHVERVVATCAVSVRQWSQDPLYLIGYPIGWVFTLYRAESFSETGPAPGSPVLNRQAGMLTMAQCAVQTNSLIEPADGMWSHETLTTWSGQVEPVNSRRSDGSMVVATPETNYYARFDLTGWPIAPPPGGGLLTQPSTYALTRSLRVLYQREIGG